MFERFVRDAHYAALEATSVAAGLGSDSVEAEHLLISLAAGTTVPPTPCARPGSTPPNCATRSSALRARAAHRRDRRQRRRPLRQLPPHQAALGRSAKQGLQRAHADAKQRGDRKVGCEHVLRGLLAAEHGTVPRILAAEGIDRDELTGRL